MGGNIGWIFYLSVAKVINDFFSFNWEEFHIELVERDLDVRIDNALFNANDTMQDTQRLTNIIAFVDTSWGLVR